MNLQLLTAFCALRINYPNHSNRKKLDSFVSHW
jgi:hypothetical protein